MRNGKLVSLLQTHGQELYTLLLRLTLCADAADDLLQDLFVKLADSDALLNAAQPYAYLRRAAINLAFDWRRRKQRRAKPRQCEGLIDESIDRQPPLWLVLARSEEVQRVLAIVEELSPLAREAFVLRHVAGAAYEEIGQSLGKTPDQARALSHSAVQEIRRRLSHERDQQLSLLRER